MARYTGPRNRISRRLQVPVFGPSKYLERRRYGPGAHGQTNIRRKKSDFALRLAEKQKFRYYYGVLEKQFRAVYEKARRSRGVTGLIMLQILETRLDNVIYRLGLAPSRPAARQMVVHGHIHVDGRRVDIPSYAVKINQKIEVAPSSASKRLADKNMESATGRSLPEWLQRDRELYQGAVVRLPTREEIDPIGNEQVVVEFYSR